MNELVKCIQTMKLVDILEYYPDILDDMVLNTEKNTKLFKDMFIAHWGFHESAFDTTDLFIRRIHDYYEVHKDFYINMLNVYQREVNELDGYVETITASSTTNDKRDETSTIESSATTELSNDNYDYPHASGNGYKTSAVNSDSESSNTTNKTYETDNDVTRNANSTNKRVNVIEQRELYYKTMKNVMLEFVKKFSPCFLMIYM